jgi:DNA-binding beta-propeller fold protein YncE
MLLSPRRSLWMTPFFIAAATAGPQGCGGGGGGAGGAGAQTHNTPVVTVSVAASGLDTPLDAAPDPAGAVIYFLAKGKLGPGVFSVPAKGGAITTLHEGAPLVEPRGVAVDPTGDALYIADPSAANQGAVFRLAPTGGKPEVIAGSEGTKPTAIDVAMAAGVDLYFTGVDEGGAPAVLKLPAEGGALAPVVTGDPLTSPEGIAVAVDGTIFVTNRSAMKDQVFAVEGSALTSLVSDILLGSPAGVALTLDDLTLLVSSLDASTDTSRVTIFDRKTEATSLFSDVIGVNKASGGIHRATFKNDFAWAAPSAGKVYSVRIKIITDSSSVAGPGD